MTTEETLLAAWKLCAHTADTSNGFPRGFWPDVARVAVEIQRQQTLEPKLDFEPTKCGRGGFEASKTKDKKKLGDSILNDLQGLF